MNNREKVIKALECCSSESGRNACPPECPYAKDFSCQGTFKLMQDALELLRAQRPVTLADMLVIRPRIFMDKKDYAKIKRRLEKQIRNGDRVLILPYFMEPAIIVTTLLNTMFKPVPTIPSSCMEPTTEARISVGVDSEVITK